MFLTHWGSCFTRHHTTPNNFCTNRELALQDTNYNTKQLLHKQGVALQDTNYNTKQLAHTQASVRYEPPPCVRRHGHCTVTRQVLFFNSLEIGIDGLVSMAKRYCYKKDVEWLPPVSPVFNTSIVWLTVRKRPPRITGSPIFWLRGWTGRRNKKATSHLEIELDEREKERKKSLDETFIY